MAKNKSQVERFREAAKEAETDDSEERFNATLKNIAKSPRRANEAGQKEPDKTRKSEN